MSTNLSSYFFFNVEVMFETPYRNEDDVSRLVYRFGSSRDTQ